VDRVLDREDLASGPHPLPLSQRERGVCHLGVVSYLNAQPLVYGLDSDSRFVLESDTPARVAERLHRGESDIGLIPSIEYALGEYALVPDLAIASRGAVRSVCLFHRGPLENLRRVALDTSSRTSAALLRLVLRARLGRDPEYVPLPPDPKAMLSACDAALLIGDPALYLESDLERWDLGQAWRELTGLPFVFAFWAGRPDALDVPQVRALQDALAAGQRALPQIAAAWNEHAALNERYLRENIVYELGPAELSGLREFYRRAHEAGLIPSVPELRFYAHHS
jgi:chorismate dehydratase